LAISADPTTVLAISQVVLTFGLPFVLVPLMRLTSNATFMEVMSIDSTPKFSAGSLPPPSSG